MARNERTPDQFDSISKELAAAAESMATLAQAVRESGMPHALVHGNTALNFHLPSILEWVDKTSADVKAQIRAYLNGVQSNAEFQKQQSDKQKKLAAARKPVKKKAT